MSALLFLLVPCVAHAATVIVDQSGAGDALTIEEGLDLTSDGDTLLIRAGVYYEYSLWFSTGGLAIQGEGADVTLLESPDPTENLSGLTTNSDTTVSDMGFRGFYLAVGQGNVSSGSGETALFERCLFEDNITGIALYNGESELYVYDSTFVDNERGVDGGTTVGVYDVHLENNLFVDNYYFAFRFESEEAVGGHDTTHNVVHNVFIDNLAAFLRNASNPKSPRST